MAMQSIEIKCFKRRWFGENELLMQVISSDILYVDKPAISSYKVFFSGRFGQEVLRYVYM